MGAVAGVLAAGERLRAAAPVAIGRCPGRPRPGRRCRRRALALPGRRGRARHPAPGTPRLLLLPDDVPRPQGAIATDGVAALPRRPPAQRERILTEAVVRRVLRRPLACWTPARGVLSGLHPRPAATASMGESAWRARALEELRAARVPSDWNPSHFLDVAEMSHAFAVGYDWLYGRSERGRPGTLLRDARCRRVPPAADAYA